MQTKYPSLDFLQCSENWDYELHTVEDATRRAERVRASLKELTDKYQNILLIAHRGFLALILLSGIKKAVPGCLSAAQEASCIGSILSKYGSK